MNTHFASLIMVTSIRVLYNSTANVFDEIFGKEDGPYLWDKFTGRFKGTEEGAFICYLDQENLNKLANYVWEKVKRGGM